MSSLTVTRLIVFGYELQYAWVVFWLHFTFIFNSAKKHLRIAHMTWHSPPVSAKSGQFCRLAICAASKTPSSHTQSGWRDCGWGHRGFSPLLMWRRRCCPSVAVCETHHGRWTPRSTSVLVCKHMHLWSLSHTNIKPVFFFSQQSLVQSCKWMR